MRQSVTRQAWPEVPKTSSSEDESWRARYTTKLTESLPAEFKDSLPSPEAIEAELESQDQKRSSVETEDDTVANRLKW